MFVNYSRRLLIILKLSVCFELNTNATHGRKVRRYAGLISDIEAPGFSVEYYPLEIGSRGFVSQDNVNRIKTLCKSIKFEAKISRLKNILSKLALLASFNIYYSKPVNAWTEPSYIKLD